MSNRLFNNRPGIFAALGLLLTAFMVVPVCLAGGAATIVQDKHQLAPRGSYIPDRRVKQVLKKVEAHKAMIKEKKSLQQEEPLEENTLPAPKSTDEK